MKIKNTDRLEVVNHRLRVNGWRFEVNYPDKPLCCVDRGRLVTLVIKGCGCPLNYWEPEEIEGDFF